ncbi:ciliogenesis and planar polarity effector 2 [Strongylocentrotus purpuratus]|uniref:Ciliogenesis and planar polarity effector 2 n=1 Tax=Strongylocentrotus purpuratus TaxID=7668 RepID=A0A7M7NXP7_STRPU|nr:ciliogenesis and planar polarity effector 2 [Strongylocentrotus purpuratus]XP_030843216.1 ciliogenesis and planar polarity effector 2 [Strongylocentrotus purpuratus]XP_788492.2 ciliogenesis and planar polarity effector 2 [Strongylocentrotus purpuratus]
MDDDRSKWCFHTLGTYINHDDWHKTPEGKDYFASILRHGKRRVFGCLESPLTLVPSHLEQPKIMKYKLCLVGKTGVGKSSTVAKLCGQRVPTTHVETPGIITSVTYWPAKLKHSGKHVMFRLQFWDAGHAVQRKFDHIHPACREKAQAVLYFFSFIDRSSFEDLRTQFSKSLSNEDTPLLVVIGTKYDQYNRSEITSRELLDFQKQWQVPILKLKNVLKPTETNALLAGDSCAEIDDVAPVMNTLVEYLWIHDQVLSGNIELSSSPKLNTSREEETHSASDRDSDEDEATYV